VKRNHLLLILLLVIVAPGTSGRASQFFEPLQPPRPFQVMAHRGASLQAPENTRPALQRAIEDGFEWVEIDLQLTRDGKHVLYHDSSLENKTDGTGRVADYSLADLGQLDAGSKFAPRYVGERLLTLPEALEIARGKINLYLYCKTVNPELLAREILDARMAQQVVVFSSPDTLQRIRRASNERVAIMPKWHPANGTGEWISRLQPAAVEIDANEVTREICRVFHGKGIKVQAKVLGQEWDRPEVWDRVIAAGADWLQTDFAEEIIARSVLKRITKRPVRISHHRGANRYAPENTLPAFEKSIRLGADFVEFDVRTTSDGQFFLLHDGDLRRTTNGSGPIRDFSSTVVRSLDAGSRFGKPFAGEKLPTLDEFLSTVAGRVDLYFDAKDISPENLSAAIQKYQLADRTVVYQSVPYLQKLRALNPRIRALPPLHDPAELDSIAATLNPYAVDARWEILTPDLISRCHAKGILVFSDSMGNHEKIEDYEKAIRWGIDLIQTDHPLRVIRAMELMMAHPAQGKGSNSRDK
jgi:glycerophosphoryl diester phosphodiesterase